MVLFAKYLVLKSKNLIQYQRMLMIKTNKTVSDRENSIQIQN